MSIKNFLPDQYKNTNSIDINHNYLSNQFADHDVIMGKIKKVVIDGDFTLGQDVDNLECEFAELSGASHAIGVGSGTDALFLSLKALGVDKGDQVITTPFTFYATIGAIVTAGAIPVFCDILDDYNINPSMIADKITSKTKAILPVHWSGNPCKMDEIESIANSYNIPIVSDACHAINSIYKGRKVGALGTISCFSFHPLKNLNVWGDGGMIVTDSSELSDKLKLMRNHGLAGRDECRIFAYNSRLDTIQAVIARHMMTKIDHITQSRVANSTYFDARLSAIPQIRIPKRDSSIYQVFHIYSILCERRDALQSHLHRHGVDAKVHYPVPMHLQPAAKYLGHTVGDFPLAEAVSARTLSLPVHEFITREQQDKVVSLIEMFYA